MLDKKLEVIGKWVVSNEKLPTKDKFYYAEDTIGQQTMVRFGGNHWHSLTGHPVAKWQEPTEAILLTKEEWSG